MPGKALPGGPRPLILERSVRLLACEFRLAVNDPELLARLDGLLPHASQQYPVSERHRLEAWQVDTGYRICEDGRERGPETETAAAAMALFYRMHELALGALPGFTKIHAGCASCGDKRLLAAGRAQSGKTTLMTRLLFEGFSVHCDDLALLRRGHVLPYPQRFWIRPPTMTLIPQLGSLAPVLDREGVTRFPLDPSELGFEWRIDLAPVDTVIFLEADHGGRTRLEPCPKYAMAERIMGQSNLPAGGARDWVSDVCALLDRADCYVLRSGDLDASVRAVQEVCSDHAGRPRRAHDGAR